MKVPRGRNVKMLWQLCGYKLDQEKWNPVFRPIKRPKTRFTPV